MENYYDTDYAEKALYWDAECNRIIGNLEDAETSFVKFIDKYKQSSLLAQAEKKLKKIRKVLDQYINKQ